MKRILIVEDERPIADMICGILSDEGYDVGIAKHGREALERMEQRQPDLLIVDVMMPIMGGVELCHELQHEEALRDIPVILMSAAGRPPNDPTCVYTRFVPKPFDIDVLIMVIEQILTPRAS